MKMRISRVLNLAADKYLSADGYSGAKIPNTDSRCRQSATTVDAINSACQELGVLSSDVHQTISRFEPRVQSYREIPIVTERQGARYMWLKLLAVVAVNTRIHRQPVL